MPQHEHIIARTLEWVEKAVIGLNLCPFAKAVLIKKQLKCEVSSATTTAELLEDLAFACAELASAAPQDLDTILLIHPEVCQDFALYNQFLDEADELLVNLELEGELQIASFHPDYEFEGEPKDDMSHYTNRAPFPILHILREDSIARATQQFPDAAHIYERNIETLRKLGLSGWQALFNQQSR